MSSAGSAATFTRNEDGFVMLELLVAIVILSVAMLALLAAVSGSLLARGKAEALTLAVEQARSRLEAVGSAAPIREGQSTVTLANGWRQQVTIRRLPLTSAISAAPDGRPRSAPRAAFAVKAAVYDRDGDLLTSLETVRLGAVP